MPRHGLSGLLSDLCVSTSPAALLPLRWKRLSLPPRTLGPSVASSSHSSGATWPFHTSAPRNFLVVSGRGGERAFHLQSPPVAYLPGACTASASCSSSPPPLNIHGDLSSGLLQIRKRPKTQENRETTVLLLATTGCSCFSNTEVQVTLGNDYRVLAAKA